MNGIPKEVLESKDYVTVENGITVVDLTSSENTLDFCREVARQRRKSQREKLKSELTFVVFWSIIGLSWIMPLFYILTNQPE